MSYHIYTTEAVILRKRDIGEADRVYSFYTKDFGRLEIKAQGVRYLKSKLRYHLSGCSLLKISFVSAGGGEYWRLVGAREQSVFNNIRDDLSRTKCAEKILSFFERLVQGQQKDEELWNTLVESLFFIDGREFGISDFKDFERGTHKKFLTHLGYGGESVERALEESML